MSFAMPARAVDVITATVAELSAVGGPSCTSAVLSQRILQAVDLVEQGIDAKVAAESQGLSRPMAGASYPEDAWCVISLEDVLETTRVALCLERVPQGKPLSSSAREDLVRNLGAVLAAGRWISDETCRLIRWKSAVSLTAGAVTSKTLVTGEGVADPEVCEQEEAGSEDFGTDRPS